MKVLLTGATGFLGKQVLQRLVDDPRISRICVPTRKSRTHPSSKVEILRLDLTNVEAMQSFQFDGDAVIHLAGLYDFSRSASANYSQNVVSTLNVISLLERVNQHKRVPIFYASSYSVGIGRGKVLDENPLDQLPPKQSRYAFSKAIAERLLTDSHLPAHVFRLGVLVGSEETGEIEKIDGPYEFLHQMVLISKIPGSRLLRRLPVPCAVDGVLPLVPVNQAAEVFHRALFHPKLTQKVYNVFNAESLKLADFCDDAVPRYLRGARPHFVSSLPQIEMPLVTFPFMSLLQKGVFKSGWAQKKFEIFRFSLDPIALSNPGFVETFGSDQIAHFDRYRKTFYKGFDHFLTDRYHDKIWGKLE